MGEKVSVEEWPLAGHDAFLAALHDRLRNEADPDVILAETTRRLALHLGASRTGYGEFDEDATMFIPRHHWTDGTVVSMDEPVPFEAFGPRIGTSHRLGELWVHETLDDPKLDDTGRAACEQLGIVAVITVPVLKAGKLRSLISVQQSQPRHWHPEDIALVVELADRTWALLERARAEAELERSREALYQSEKMMALGSLLAGVSHELNNPLSIIAAQAELLELEAAGSAAAERAGKIRRAAERSARIVQTFLAMARQKAPDRAPVQLNDVVKAALELAAYGFRSTGITVDLRLAGDLPLLMGDADQLHQVVVNLVINAQQAMQEHGGERTLTLTTGAGGRRGTLFLDVADTGPGIPAELRRRIFEPFFTTKPQGAGTGVGLSFSQGIVEAHGGSLEVVDRRRGAAFRLTLPVGTAPAKAERGRDTAGASAAASPRRRALVVDDEPELAESLADILSLLGFVVTTSHDGATAIEALGRGSFDVVISDVRMPGVDGPALHAWLEANQPGAVARLAFSTGDTLSGAAERFLAASGRPYMEKPFSLASVRALVEAIDASREAAS